MGNQVVGSHKLPPLVGHVAQREMLTRLVRLNRLPSTMLFAGSAGIGKRRVALELSRSLFCIDLAKPYGGCGACKNCHLAEVNNLPDAQIIDCADHDKFDLDALRDLLHTLNRKPFLGGSRVIILDNAEQLTVQASNLLLKSLEEPRADNYFILVCSNPAMLPPTLLSRCQVWFFDRLKETDVRNILTALGYSANVDELTQLSDGSLAGISSLQAQLGDWHDLSSDLRSIGDGDLATAIMLAGELSKDKEKLREKLSFLRISARTHLAHAHTEDEAFRWSSCMLDLVSAERLIFERNLGANYVLTLVLSKVADRRSFTRSLRGATLLDHVAV